MATSTTQATTAAATTIDEMKLLSDFYNLVIGRQSSKNVTINELTLSYSKATGFSIKLDEVSNSAAQAAMEAGTQA